jgi:hypothetical protein
MVGRGSKRMQDRRRKRNGRTSKEGRRGGLEEIKDRRRGGLEEDEG